MFGGQLVVAWWTEAKPNSATRKPAALDGVAFPGLYNDPDLKPETVSVECLAFRPLNLIPPMLVSSCWVLGAGASAVRTSPTFTELPFCGRRQPTHSSVRACQAVGWITRGASNEMTFEQGPEGKHESES